MLCTCFSPKNRTRWETPSVFPLPGWGSRQDTLYKTQFWMHFSPPSGPGMFEKESEGVVFPLVSRPRRAIPSRSSASTPPVLKRYLHFCSPKPLQQPGTGAPHLSRLAPGIKSQMQCFVGGLPGRRWRSTSSKGRRGWSMSRTCVAMQKFPGHGKSRFSDLRERDLLAYGRSFAEF